MKYCLETLNGAYGRRDVLLSLLLITSQFASGRVYAKIISRPGQSGRCDEIVLEGPALVFYQKMMAKK